MVTVTHATVAVGTDAGTGEIHKAQWNENHTLTGLDATPLAFAQAQITHQTTIPATSTWTDITDATVTLTTGARKVRISATIWDQNQTGTANTSKMRIVIDGTPLDTNGEFRQDINIPVAVAGHDNNWVIPGILSSVLTAASHTIKLQAWNDVGTQKVGLASDTVGYLTVEEVPDYTPGGTVLYANEYRPGSDAATYSTSSTSLVDIDATNLIFSFTAPSSGRVKVLLGGVWFGPGSNFAYVGLRDGSGAVAGSSVQGSSDGGAQLVWTEIGLIVSGLTPGTTYNWRWAWRMSGGTGSLYGGPNFGSFMTTVIAL